MNIENIEIKKDAEIVFMGTPDFAVPVLQALIDNYRVKAVVTQPDKKVGRKGEIKFSPIKQLALDNNILVLQPVKLKDEWEEVVGIHPNLIVTCAYGQIVPRELLVYPEYGCINVHASLLPKLRGGAPIHRAIIDGHKKTGITIMHMAPTLDSGDIISQKEVEITSTDTASSLHDKLSELGPQLLLETLPSILDKTSPREKQNEDEATFAFNIKKEDEKIDFSKTKREIYNQVRGLNSWPGAYALLKEKRVKVWVVEESDRVFSKEFDGEITGFYDNGIGVKVSNGEIILKIIQPEGKRAMKAVDYYNGLQNKESLLGEIFR